MSRRCGFGSFGHKKQPMCLCRSLASVAVWVAVPSLGRTGMDPPSSSPPSRTSTMESMWPSTGEQGNIVEGNYLVLDICYQL